MNNSPLISLILLNYIEMYDNDCAYETFFYKGKQYLVLTSGVIPSKDMIHYTDSLFLFYNNIPCPQYLTD